MTISKQMIPTEGRHYELTWPLKAKIKTGIYLYQGKDMGGAFTFVNDAGIFKTKNLELITIKEITEVK